MTDITSRTDGVSFFVPGNAIVHQCVAVNGIFEALQMVASSPLVQEHSDSDPRIMQSLTMLFRCAERINSILKIIVEEHHAVHQKGLLHG